MESCELIRGSITKEKYRAMSNYRITAMEARIMTPQEETRLEMTA